MGTPGREFSIASQYRYGFNGKENDNDVKGERNQQDYGMRIYDVRLGRFLSIDPVTSKYPELTPYQFASNRPIDGIDLDGLEWWRKVLHVINPVAGAVSDKEIREGFVQRAKEFAHGIKNLPAVVQEFLESSGKLGTPGSAFVKDQQKRQAEFYKALYDGGVAAVMEFWGLIKSTAQGDKKAAGGLAFEILALIIPDAPLAKAFSATGRFGKLLSTESRALIKKVGKLEGSTREIAIGTTTGTRLDALKIAEDLTGNVPANAKIINGKQGLLKDQPVGFEWRGEDGVFRRIRLDHDLKTGPHVNVTVGKEDFSIPFNMSENQVKQIGTNEIMKEIKKN